MTVADDSRELLRLFVVGGAEDAFAELVRRHLDLVYSTALRRCGGDGAVAKDVAQIVFTDLARKARRLPRNVILPGWLYRHTIFVSGSWIRSESRRRQREAIAMDLDAPRDNPDWSAIAPVLEGAMQELPGRDRDALVLRFLDQHSFAHVGEHLGVSEDAARMRVARALDRLRGLLRRRGIGSTATALAMVLGQHATTAAPASLASTITAGALASAVAALAPSTTALGILHMTTLTKITVGTAAVLTAGALTTAWIDHRENAHLEAQLASERSATASLRADLEAARLPAAGRKEDAGRDDQRQVELMSLRDKAARLRETEGELTRLRDENQRLQANLAKASAAAQTGRQTETTAESNPEAEAARGLALARMNYAKFWGMALMEYAAAHQGQMPNQMQDAAEFFPKDWRSTMSAFDPNHFEIVYRGSVDALANPAATIILREKEAYMPPADGEVPKRYARTYLFADGHSEIHSAPNGDFTAWESQHMVGEPPR